MWLLRTRSGRVNPRRRLRVLGSGAACVSLVALGVAITNPASADTAFTFGSGFAQASLVTPALNAGELSVPVIVGEAAAGYQDETGRATSTMFAIPLLGAVGGGGDTCGVPGGATSLPLPPPLLADTASKQNKGNVDQQQGKNGQGGVVQEVHATPRSSGASRTQFADVELPNLLTVGGATARATTVADSQKLTRRASATATVADVRLLGGLLRLTGMRWDLTQTRDGADSRSSKTKVTHAFALDGITIDPAGAIGLPIPAGLIPKITIPIATPKGAAAAVKTVNTLLEPIGLTVELPRFDDNGQGRQVVTPLRVKIGGPNWLLTPVLGAALSQQQIVEAQGDLFELLFDPKDCDQLFGLFKGIPPLNAQYNSLGGTAPLLTAAVIGVLSGGSATISFGGVAASLDDTYFPGLNFGAPTFSQDPGIPAIPGSQGTAVLPRIPSLGSKTSVSTKRSPCETSSPAGRPGCWRGLAPIAAAAAGVIALGSLATDEILTRRRVAALARNEIS